MKLAVTGLKHLQRIAEIIAPSLMHGDVILLDGNLGAGKTSLAQALIQACAQEETEVSSPTFALQHIYNIIPQHHVTSIAHMDLYRLEKESELADLGLEEYFQTHLCLIEWPNKLGAHIPNNYIYIGIEITGEQSRQLTLKSSESLSHHVENIYSNLNGQANA